MQHLGHAKVYAMKGDPMFKFNPLTYWKLAAEAGQIMAESQAVIGLRMAGMAGLWPMGQAENSRMIHEKLAAATQSQQAALRSAMSGGSLPEIARAAMKPVGRRTKANVRRLAKSAQQKG